jgi:tight adherence protein C
MAAALMGLCALLVVAAGRELWVEHGERRARVLERRLHRARRRLPGPLGGGEALGALSGERLIREAGLEGRLPASAVISARAAAALSALPVAAMAAPVAPARSGVLVLIGVPAAALLAPDLLLGRLASARRRRLAAGLVDTLELMAVGAAAGRAAPALLSSAAESAAEPLRAELRDAVVRLECGCPSSEVFASLAERSGGELTSLTLLLERSRRVGSPLAGRLHEQAMALREARARTIAERAARAAPKIQLVVALLLVPSVLLIVAAAVLANSGALLAGL